METLNLLTGAGSSTRTKQIPQQAEMNINLQKEINGHKRNKMNRNGRTPADTDRNGQKDTGAEEEEKDFKCHLSCVTCCMNHIKCHVLRFIFDLSPMTCY